MGVADIVAGKETLVVQVAAAKGAASDVPSQMKEFGTLQARGGVGSQVMLQVGAQFGSEVGLARQSHQAAGTQQLQDFDHSGVKAAGIDIFRHGQRETGRGESSPFIRSGVNLGGSQQGFDDFQVHNHFAQAILHMGLLAGAEGFHHQGSRSQEKLGFRQDAGNDLVEAVDNPTGAVGQIVAALHIAQQKDALPRHQYIVENHHGVHFLKARAQGMVKGGAAVVKAFPADKAQARRSARNGKRQGVFIGVGHGLMGTGGINGDFVGEGAEGSQHPGAAHHYAVIPLFNHPQSHILGQVVGVARLGDAGTLRIDQSMGQAQILFPDQFIVALDVVAEFRADGGEVGGGPGHSDKGGVHIIGGAPHHPAVELGPLIEHCPPPFQVGQVAGGQERHSYRVAGSGRGVGHQVPQIGLMLQIVEGGYGTGAVSQAGMGSDIGNPGAVNPDFRGPVFKALQVLGAGAGRHRADLAIGYRGDYQYNRVGERWRGAMQATV